MNTTENEEGPPKRANLLSEIAAAPLENDFSSDQSTAQKRHDDGYAADARWQTNFERMARRASHERRFYAIAGCNVRRRADEIRAGWS
ncbi:hypothetical protein [Mycobacterium paraense]|uniref:hypothetical protein n=1 Tax=Mycobacterium paraense TaxID=767916 RepID=UPI0011518355|nr:hypothetical protein [Mycobacterium paraense]